MLDGQSYSTVPRVPGYGRRPNPFRLGGCLRLHQGLQHLEPRATLAVEEQAELKVVACAVVVSGVDRGDPLTSRNPLRLETIPL